MSHYLVVAHGITASDLVTCLRRLTVDDARGAFTLLETATHAWQAFTGQTPALEAAARARTREGRARLEAAGVYLVRTLVGDGSPQVAVDDEMRSRPETYDAVVLCTARPGLRAWLAGDLRTRIEARAGLPVFHLHAASADPWRRVRTPRSARLSRWWERTLLAPSPAEATGSAVPSRRQLLPVVCLLLAYLAGGLALAIGVDRGFLLNDAIALVVYTVVIGGLLAALRSDV